VTDPGLLQRGLCPNCPNILASVLSRRAPRQNGALRRCVRRLLQLIDILLFRYRAGERFAAKIPDDFLSCAKFHLKPCIAGA
jgi:hypothetical protein